MQTDQQVEKDLGVSLPPVTWNADDEARVLEDALWEAALVASKIEGASVKVRFPTNTSEHHTLPTFVTSTHLARCFWQRAFYREQIWLINIVE